MPEFLNAGLAPSFVDYEAGWELQRSIHTEVASGTRPDTVILLEHTPVYTAGKRTEDSERPQDGTPVIDVDRGGKITWHGPGQLVGYPIVRLPMPLDVVAHVRRLEGALISACAEVGLATTRVDGRSGVWVSADDRGPDRKVAAIGVRVAQGVTLHGFALNCDCDMAAFDRIVAKVGAYDPPEERRAQLLMDLSLNLKALVSQRLMPRQAAPAAAPVSSAQRR